MSDPRCEAVAVLIGREDDVDEEDQQFRQGHRANRADDLRTHGCTVSPGEEIGAQLGDGFTFHVFRLIEDLSGIQPELQTRYQEF